MRASLDGKFYEEKPRKVHLYHDQQGATYQSCGSTRRYADTLCKANHRSPMTLTTKDHSKVTCKICLKAMYKQPIVSGPPLPKPFEPKFRVRRGLFGRLVLQISEEKIGHRDQEGGWQPRGSVTVWRDAKVEDVIFTNLSVGVVNELRSK